jgi:hypothetical protein
MNYVFPLDDDGYLVSDIGLKQMPTSLRLCSPKKDNRFPGLSACAVVLAFPEDPRFSSVRAQEVAKQIFRSMFADRAEISKALTQEIDASIEKKLSASKPMQCAV